VKIQNEHAFPPYGLPPNYTPPNVAYTPNEDVNNSTPILVESRQPHHVHVSQPMGETHEIPHLNLADFEPFLGYAIEGQAVGGIPLQNTLEGPQFCPQPQVLFLSFFDPAKSESEYPTKLHKEFLGYHNLKLTVPNKYLIILFTAIKCENFGSD